MEQLDDINENTIKNIIDKFFTTDWGEYFNEKRTVFFMSPAGFLDFMEEDYNNEYDEIYLGEELTKDEFLQFLKKKDGVDHFDYGNLLENINVVDNKFAYKKEYEPYTVIYSVYDYNDGDVDYYGTDNYKYSMLSDEEKTLIKMYQEYQEVAEKN